MKMFTKVMLILAGVFGSIGVICMVAAFAMGLTTTHLWEMVENGQFSFDLSDIQISQPQNSTSEKHILQNCSRMEIEFGAGLLEVCYDDVEEIQVKSVNLPNLKAEVKNDTLVIGEKSNISINFGTNKECKLTIILPRNTQFETVEMEVGAGQAKVSGLLTQKFEIEVGAGQVEVELNGVQNDYNYNIECGVGKVVIGETSYAGLGAEQSIKNEGATKELKVECGVGEVLINFVE